MVSTRRVDTSAGGHRIKTRLEYSRGPDKVWVYGALRVHDGCALTLAARSRNTAGYLELLGVIDSANPVGDVYVIQDNLCRHTSAPIQAWLTDHPRVKRSIALGRARVRPRVSAASFGGRAHTSPN